MSRFYFPLAMGIMLLMLAGFVFFALYQVSTWKPETYYFYGDAPHTPYLEREVASLPFTLLRWLLLLVILGFILPIILTILMELVRWEVDRRRGKIIFSPPQRETGYILRFDSQQVLQHYLILGSVLIVGLVGLPQSFPQWPVAKWWIEDVWGGIEVARLVHHRIGYLVDFTIFYHLGYLAYRGFVKKDLSPAMVPNWKDLKDFGKNYLYIFGILPEEPKYERFSYGQKIDYWFLLLCLPLLSLTGLTIYYTSITSHFLPDLAIASAALLHRNLALLAAWFILIVHIYYGHLAPRVFPFNSVIFTGGMKEEQYKDLYALDYARRKEISSKE